MISLKATKARLFGRFSVIEMGRKTNFNKFVSTVGLVLKNIAERRLHLGLQIAKPNELLFATKF